MIHDWRLAEALAIQRWQGDRAAVWVGECIGALATSGDDAGVERFKTIAIRLDGLLRATTH